MDSNNKDLVNKNLCQEQYKEIGIQVTVFQSDDGFRADVYIKFDEGYEVGWLTGDPYPDGKFYLWNCGNPWLERPGDMYMVLDGLEE